MWERRSEVSPEELLQTLSDWIVGHIQGMDQDLRGKV
jgi:hemerythrin